LCGNLVHPTPGAWQVRPAGAKWHRT
jgi:hypothetical protein